MLVVSICGHSESARGAQARGHAGRKIFRGCARKIILTCDLLRQAKDQCQVPVQIQVS